MKYPPSRYQTEEEKYLAAIDLHTTEARKYQGWADQCSNPRTKANYQHSADSSWEQVKKERQNLEEYRLRQRRIPVQAPLMEVA